MFYAEAYSSTLITGSVVVLRFEYDYIFFLLIFSLIFFISIVVVIICRKLTLKKEAANSISMWKLEIYSSEICCSTDHFILINIMSHWITQIVLQNHPSRKEVANELRSPCWILMRLQRPIRSKVIYITCNGIRMEFLCTFCCPLLRNMKKRIQYA